MIMCLDDFENLWLKSDPFITGYELTAVDIWADCEVEQPRIAGYDPEGATKKGGTKRYRNESTSEKLSPTNKNGSTSSHIDNNENCIKGSDVSNFDEVADEAVNTLLSLQQEINDRNEIKENEEVKETCSNDLTKREEYVKNVLKGWTLETCNAVSVGELYLMFGSNSRLVLEYSWDVDKEVIPKIENCDNNEIDISGQTISCLHESSKIRNTLDRLLSIAKLQYRKNLVKCPCGHVCSGNKSNINKTKPPITKVKLPEKVIPEIQEKLILNENTNTTEQSKTSIVPIIIQSPLTLFRRPASPNTDTLQAQLDSIQRLPRYCNRRGRKPRAKQVVVERRLPLLPNKTDSGRQIVQMNIIPHGSISSLPRSIAPKILSIDKAEHNITNVINVSVNEASIQNLCSNTNIDNNVNVAVSTETLDINDSSVASNRVESPTSISNLLSLAMTRETEDILNHSVLENKKDASISNFAGFLSSNATPPTSPSRILRENDNQWLNSEVGDYSLSSLLGHLESPMKAAPSISGISTDDSHLSQDVDAQLQSLLTESSVDYVAQFADLAAQVSDAKK
ncbi:hypothetical protein FQA39_LY17250 [Lamprigera yunnana]|nr:hypothetical protein FQA39_LY17250 [Lamprigera yunnana]